MLRSVFAWFLLLAIFVASVISSACNFQIVNSPNLPDSPKPWSRTDGCAVSQKAAKVHEEKYEHAWIQLVNNDDTVQIQTTNTKLTLLIEVGPQQVVCFQEGSIVPVTIAKCKKKKNGECDFALPHMVYVRTQLVHVVNWTYLKPVL